MKLTLAMVALFGWLGSVQAQSTNAFPLWPGGAPDALGTADKDIPALTPFFPAAEKATGAAMVICPGGGYGGLAPHEGEHYARFLNESGVAGFVLKYRLGSGGYRHPVMLHVIGQSPEELDRELRHWAEENAFGPVASRRMRTRLDRHTADLRTRDWWGAN